MQVLATGGNYAAALEVYRELRLLLHRELNGAPDPETTALFQQLRAEARHRAQAPAPDLSLPQRTKLDVGAEVMVLPGPPTAPGTITFLPTAIEGSTKLWPHHPDARRLALARHDALLTACIEDHSGTVLKQRGEGDSCFTIFSRATDAVAAAVALQQALAL